MGPLQQRRRRRKLLPFPFKDLTLPQKGIIAYFVEKENLNSNELNLLYDMYEPRKVLDMILKLLDYKFITESYREKVALYTVDPWFRTRFLLICYDPDELICAGRVKYVNLKTVLKTRYSTEGILNGRKCPSCGYYHLYPQF